MQKSLAFWILLGGFCILNSGRCASNLPDTNPSTNDKKGQETNLSMSGTISGMYRSSAVVMMCCCEVPVLAEANLSLRLILAVMEIVILLTSIGFYARLTG